MKKFGKDHPHLLNVAHTFENFLLACNFVETLLGGQAEFMAMMASIIREVYHFNMDELKQASAEASAAKF